MDFAGVKERADIKSLADEWMDGKGSMHNCPACGSGAGPHRTPALRVYPETRSWKCFSCGEAGDVFDLAGWVFSTDDKREQLRIVCEAAGIVEDADGAAEARPKPRPKPSSPSERNEVPTKPGRPDEAAALAEGAVLIERAAAAIGEKRPASYLADRGFTVDEARTFGWGYDEKNDAIVLPYGPDAPGYYTLRYLEPKNGRKYGKPPGIPEPRCLSDLEGARVAFVVEGLFDAFAVRACGFRAVALNGCGNAKACSRAIAERGFDGCIVAMLDDDDAGNKAAETVVSALSAAGIAATKFSGALDHDPAETMRRDRAAFAAALAEETAAAEAKVATMAEAAYLESLKRLRAIDPFETMLGIYNLADAEEPVPTGIDGLDDALDGGLHRGVAVLGAISSLGKTTLTVQMADHIAASGRPVLFVTIEQSAQELVSKSLSRLMRFRGIVAPDAFLRSAARASWGEDEQNEFFAACEDYGKATYGRLALMECSSRPSVADIEALAKAIRDHHGIAPIVFIDYLQLLAPTNDRDTEKQAIDKNITALRQMARMLRTAVFAISSLNRSSYGGAVSLDGFKESGGIEYGADVLLGMQPLHMRERMKGRKDGKGAEEIIDKTKSANERECEIVVLKNRFGRTPREGVPVVFYPASNVIVDGTLAGASKLPPVRLDFSGRRTRR